mmetsp:Transcript_1999/g.4596  ORF Transcript_1999/g.4596 Transcript_1999/m.4596 type:complete len:91 (+) Transcript_1999:1478-1750(+)
MYLFAFGIFVFVFVFAFLLFYIFAGDGLVVFNVSFGSMLFLPSTTKIHTGNQPTVLYFRFSWSLFLDDLVVTTSSTEGVRRGVDQTEIDE